MPSVSIHAPVLTAAVISPLLKACLTLGGRVKFSEPPWTVSSSLGLSICHSLSISWSSASGFESTATRTNWTGNTWVCWGLRDFSQVLLVWLFCSYCLKKILSDIIANQILFIQPSKAKRLSCSLLDEDLFLEWSHAENRSVTTTRVVTMWHANEANNHFFFGLQTHIL